MLIDFHVHSSYDPSVALSPADLLQQARASGLDGLCLTDVHTVAVERELRELARLSGLTLFVGFEAITEQGHFLVFVPEPDSLPDVRAWLRTDTEGHLSFASLREAVVRRQGILIATHPFDRSVTGFPGDRVTQLAGLAAIETLNGRRPAMVNDLADEVAHALGLPAVGGSDTRTSLSELGKVATLVRGCPKNEAELIDCVRAGDVWPVSLGAAPAPAPARRPDRPYRERSASDRPPRRDDSPGRGRHDGPPNRERHDRRGPPAGRSNQPGGDRPQRPGQRRRPGPPRD